MNRSVTTTTTNMTTMNISQRFRAIHSPHANFRLQFYMCDVITVIITKVLYLPLPCLCCIVGGSFSTAINSMLKQITGNKRTDYIRKYVYLCVECVYVRA